MKTDNTSLSPDIQLLVETSWEVCNKIGGIYTVLSTKAKILQEKFGPKLVFIGPDVCEISKSNCDFREDPTIFDGFSSKVEIPEGITVRSGYWDIPGRPQVILIKFNSLYSRLDDIFGLMWEKFGVESLHEYGDYRESCAFSIAVAIVIEKLISHLKIHKYSTIAHFNEWTTGMGLLYLRLIMPECASIFTTHATSIGRSICGNNKPLYDYFEGYNGDQMAQELNMEAKHSLEKKAAHFADCFTAVSEVTAKECQQLLEKRPEVVTPNGFEPDFVPTSSTYKKLREKGRNRILKIASLLKKREFDKDTFIIATSGRNEYRNKGLDLFLDINRFLDRKSLPKQIISLVLVPAWVKDENEKLLRSLETGRDLIELPLSQTHNLNNEETDSIACRIRELHSRLEIDREVNIIYVPCYLDGNDGIINISYYDLLPALDMTVFPSYYEPWGYTPLESIAFAVPTVTTDKSGFGQWILSNYKNTFEDCGVSVVERTDSNYDQVVATAAERIENYIKTDSQTKKKVREKAISTSAKADWKYFFKAYEKAFEIASIKRDNRLKTEREENN